MWFAKSTDPSNEQPPNARLMFVAGDDRALIRTVREARGLTTPWQVFHALLVDELERTGLELITEPTEVDQ